MQCWIFSSGHRVLFYLLPMAVGVGALWLPTQGTVANTPWYLELSVATKITIGFFLGECAPSLTWAKPSFSQFRFQTIRKSSH